METQSRCIDYNVSLKPTSLLDSYYTKEYQMHFQETRYLDSDAVTKEQATAVQGVGNLTLSFE